MKKGLLTALLAASVSTTALAAPIVYTINGTGSGTLGATSFTNAAFTFTLMGDTSSYAVFPSYTIIDPLASANYSIAGLGSGSFQIPTALGQSNTGGVFFTQSGSNMDLFDFFAPPVDLRTIFGPVNGTGVFALNQFVNIPTSGGLLSFTASSDVLFSSAMAAVPEPASWALMIGGFGAAGAALRRRKMRVRLRYS